MKAFAVFACLLACASLGRANIVEVAVSVPDLSTLVAAVQAANLTDALANPEAFELALGALNVTLEDVVANTELLTNILAYHVVPGVAAASTDLVDGQVLPTLLGQNITVSIGADGVSLISANPAVPAAKADVASGDALGSIVHVIDFVLVPEL
ncbi:hypothetical protein COHA_006918 [Chlorella ohadii]|uniref:FAS1 domain-containing protein n=1 Tax=Chlorella ohadii TaxID=2649997 RepID=A0AAD5DJU1_9CHLO|nr:hypothetical protein COHA_006918 [Chlorella ohadii]